MMNMLRDLMAGASGMPAPMYYGFLFIGGGGGFCALAYLVYVMFGQAAWIIIGGAVVVIVILIGLAALVKWSRKRKANPMERDIMGQAGSAPQGVSAASRRAALDDLRRNFEGGVGKFRAAGKNLYSLPWYAVVGEPGSGKTEAVRHSCIGFPPGLHDPLQGAGGTINMNWWFTDKAVVLDTAGRLMFEEVPAGSTSEWDEFLRLLRTYRHNCPVNGLLLVIPSDTLITDTADQIKVKANKIAEQLHRIQRVLEVRFPVFVIITKCDLINGFREFFDNVADPDLQQQLVGWSNPAPLDERFNPELVSQHLETVCERLRRRRLGLMIDPVHTEDPNGHRVDQVDALYALPQSLARLAPRLKHYLDHVFAGGEWTGKPLFLRGIYFTSSMREGSVLDEELAEALGVPVQSIADGRQWERERSYFLRDLFLEKVFKEKGLVTRAAHAGRMRRRRKVVVLGATAAAALIFGILTWLGVSALQRSIGVHRDYWVAAAKGGDEGNWRDLYEDSGRVAAREFYWQPIVSADTVGSTNFRYNGNAEIRVGRDKVRLAEFHGKLAALPRAIRIPWIFRLAAIGRNLTENRDQAQQLLIERSIVRPLLDAVRVKMTKRDAAKWPDKDFRDKFTPALAKLLRLESPSAGLKAVGDLQDLLDLRAKAETVAAEERDPILTREASTAVRPVLDALFGCALYREPEREETDPQKRKEAEEKCQEIYGKNSREYEGDTSALSRAMMSLYMEGGQTSQRAAGTGTKASHTACLAGVGTYVKYWGLQGETALKQLGQVRAIKDIFFKEKTGFKDTEKRLLDIVQEFDPRLERPTERKVDVIKEALGQWEERLKALDAVKDSAKPLLDVLPDGPLFGLYERTSNAVLKEIAEAFQRFRDQAGIAAKAEEKKTEGEAAEKFQGLADKVNTELDTALKAIESKAKAPTDAQDVRLVDTEFLEQVDLAKPLHDRLVTDGFLQARANHKLRLFEVRLVMYHLGDAERAKTDNPGDVGSFAKLCDAVEKGVSAAVAGVNELRDLKPTAFRFPEASTASAFTAKKLAMPQRIYRTLYDALTKAPKSEEEVVTEVEKAAAAAAPLIRPKIPLTNMKGGNFEPKYHPKAVVAVLGKCREAGDVLADKNRDVLERDKLGALWEKWNSATTKYLSGQYLRYWTQQVPNDLESHGEEWNTFRQQVEASKIEDVLAALDDVSRAMSSALADDVRNALAPDAQKQFQTSSENVGNNGRRLQNNIHIGQWRNVRTNWCKLGEDPFEARSRLAALSRQEIDEGYLAFSYKVPDEFVDKYWTDLTYECLRLIIEGAGKLGERIYEDILRRYAKFPLDKAPVQEVGKDDSLTAVQVNEARNQVEKLVLRWKEPAAVRPADIERMERHRAIVEKMLADLRNLRLTPPQWDWIMKVKGVLEGLPSGDKTLKCEVWLPRNQDTPAPSAALRWVHIRMYQGGKEIGKGNTQPGADYKLCDVLYPDPDPARKLDIRLYRNPVDAEPNRAIDCVNLWSAVRMLHPGELADPLYRDRGVNLFRHSWQAEVKVEKAELLDPKKRDILLTIEDDQKMKRQLRLRLEFEKGLPRFEDWPTRQAR